LVIDRMTPKVVLVANAPLWPHQQDKSTHQACTNTKTTNRHRALQAYLPPRICSRVLTTSSGEVMSAATMPPTAPPTKCRYEYDPLSGTRALVAAAAAGAGAAGSTAWLAIAGVARGSDWAAVPVVAAAMSLKVDVAERLRVWFVEELLAG